MAMTGEPTAMPEDRTAMTGEPPVMSEVFNVIKM